jgi:NAD-dependent dihydropyrimidine dehydrogenase PreA subunit
MTNPNDIASSNPRVIVHAELCKGCGLCISACPKGALTLSERTNRNGYRFCAPVGEVCIGCGTCYYSCPEPGAILVYGRERKTSSEKAS